MNRHGRLIEFGKPETENQKNNSKQKQLKKYKVIVEKNLNEYKKARKIKIKQLFNYRFYLKIIYIIFKQIIICFEF